jgi:hypothetical protein
LGQGEYFGTRKNQIYVVISEASISQEGFILKFSDKGPLTGR